MRDLVPSGGDGRENSPAGRASDRGLLGSVIDSNLTPTMLLEGGGRVVMVSASAEPKLAGDYGIFIAEGGHLDFRDSANQTEFRDLLSKVFEAPADRPASTPRIAVMHVADPGGEHTHLLTLRPLSPTPLENGQAGRKLLLACLHIDEQVAGRPSIPDDILRDMFGLTRAQAAVTAAIGSGKSLKQYCETAGIGITTARWHLRDVFSVIGVRNQTQLVKLLTSIFR